MHVLISGEAAGVIVPGRDAMFYGLDGSAKPVHPSTFGALFAGCSDVEARNVTRLQEAQDASRALWRADRALRFFLMLLDADEPDEDAGEYAEVLEGLLADSFVAGKVEAPLFSDCLPNNVDADRARRVSANKSTTLEFLEHVISYQPTIRLVREAFDAVDIRLFGGLLEKSIFLDALIKYGSVRDMVLAVGEHSKVDFVLLSMLARHRSLPGSNEVIRSWTSSLRSSRKAIRVEVGSEHDDPHEQGLVEKGEPWRGKGGRRAYENVLQQQSAVITQIKARNLDKARRYASALISDQEHSSTPEQTAKSLSKLAQEAKRLEVPELQLEWAEWATRVNPYDLRTYGHLADALIGVGRYAEAARALDQTESLGDRTYAENGRARILRETGRLDEARAKYLASAATADDEGQFHALVGAAEVLRDMGRFDSALAEYEALVARWPLESTLWAGLASVLMDMGRFDEAITTFGKAAAHGGDRTVPRTGRATVLRLSGRFREALIAFEEVISESPNNNVALCGRAEVLAQLGRIADALSAYDEALVRSPFSPVPYTGKAQLLLSQNRIPEAEVLYATATERFPYDRRVAQGRVNVLKRKGEFDHALVQLDANIQRFPFDMFPKAERAALLKRSGRLEAALDAYNEILKDKPGYDLAIRSKAALLIVMNRFGEAEALLPDEEPLGQDGWSRYVLRALLAKRKGDVARSEKMLTQAIRRVPFERERRYIRSALASLKLEKGHFSAALKTVEAAPGEVTNVVYFHALAAERNVKLARTVYNEIISSVQSSQMIVELSKEIARRLNIVNEPPVHTRQWIFDSEAEGLLLEAA